MYPIFRSLLFKLEPETAHYLTLQLLRTAGSQPFHSILRAIYCGLEKPVTAFGLTFKNPIGLAAGYDKDGMAIHGLSTLGFGHIEIGTVTPRPQPGNPSPRVFRLIEDEAVINRMGFPSRGSEFVQKRLSPQPKENVLEKFLGVAPRFKKNNALRNDKGGFVLGVNIGKNKDTPNEEAVLDYVSLVDSFSRLADFLTVNISSPNTAGLRRLQERNALENLLSHIHQQRVISEKVHEKHVPILVKLAPDLSEAELDDAIEAILHTHMDGIIVTNTTLSREGLRSALQREAGGLSGRPLRARSEAVLAQTLKRVNGAIPVVSAGGIMNPEDAKRRLEMGATLVQIYTGLIYRGPGLAKKIINSL